MKFTQTALGSLAAGWFAFVAPGLAQAAPDSGLSIGGNLGLSPAGTIKARFGDETMSEDTATAFSIGGLLEYRVTRYVSIGFAPNIILGVKGESDDSSGTEIDLPLRVAVGGPVTPRVRMYGFVSPGYSVLFLPEELDDVGFGNASGFMIGFGGGVGFHVAPNVVLTGELGYQFHSLSTDLETTVGPVTVTTNVPIDVNYLTLAIGIVASI